MYVIVHLLLQTNDNLLQYRGHLHLDMCIKMTILTVSKNKQLVQHT